MIGRETLCCKSIRRTDRAFCSKVNADAAIRPIGVCQLNPSDAKAVDDAETVDILELDEAEPAEAVEAVEVVEAVEEAPAPPAKAKAKAKGRGRK